MNELVKEYDRLTELWAKANEMFASYRTPVYVEHLFKEDKDGTKHILAWDKPTRKWCLTYVERAADNQSEKCRDIQETTVEIRMEAAAAVAPLKNKLLAVMPQWLQKVTDAVNTFERILYPERFKEEASI